MPRGNSARKLAITVDADLYDRIVSAAAQDGLSISAWMTAAARRALLIRDGLAAVADWERDDGALTDDEIRAARLRVSDELPRNRTRTA